MAKVTIGTEAATLKGQELARSLADYRTRHSQDIAITYADLIEAGPADIKRRRKAAKSLRFFCETYFGNRFFKPWAKYHLDGIKKLESVIREGKQYAMAWPRGGGKSALCMAAIFWGNLKMDRKLSNTNLFIFNRSIPA